MAVVCSPKRGSSPRVRGTRHINAWTRYAPRFIPACAGNTAYHGWAPSSAFGSSPRVRGTRLMNGYAILFDRFIPACAGNTEASTRAAPMVSGSSPRVRGTLRKSCPWPSYQRFIPACAGNTSENWKICVSFAVHPRVCGEHTMPDDWKAEGGGSSPRVRGTPGTAQPAVSARRFIPACAGNTVLLDALKGVVMVHPRVCGEHPPSPG